MQLFYFIILLIHNCLGLEIYQSNNNGFISKNHKISHRHGWKTLAMVIYGTMVSAFEVCDNLQGSSWRNLMDPRNFTIYNDTITHKDFCEQALNFPSPLGYFFYYEDFFQTTNQSILSIKSFTSNNLNNPCPSSTNFTNDTPYNRVIDYNTEKIYHFCSCKSFCDMVFKNQYYYWMAHIDWASQWGAGCQMDPFKLINYDGINWPSAIDNDYKNNKFFLRNVTKKLQENTSLTQEISCINYLNQQQAGISYDDVYNNLYHGNVQSFFLNCGQDLTVLGLFQWKKLYEQNVSKALANAAATIANTAVVIGNAVNTAISNIQNIFGNFFKFSRLNLLKTSPFNYRPLPRKKDYFAEAFGGILQFSCWPLLNTRVNFTGANQYFLGIHNYNFSNAVVAVNVTALMVPNYFQVYKENDTQKVYGKLYNGSVNILDKNYSLWYDGKVITMDVPWETAIHHGDFSVKNRRILYKKPLTWTYTTQWQSHNNSLIFYQPEINQWMKYSVTGEKLLDEDNFLYIYQQVKQKTMVEFFSSLLSVDKNTINRDWIGLMDKLYAHINPSSFDNKDVISEQLFVVGYTQLNPPLELIKLSLDFQVIITKQQAQSMVDAINDGLIYKDILITATINEKFLLGNLCRNKEFIPEPWSVITSLNYTESLKAAQQSRKLLRLLGLDENYGQSHDYFMTHHQLVDLLFQELILLINCQQLPFSMVTSNDFYKFFNDKFFLPMINSHLNPKIIVDGLEYHMLSLKSVSQSKASNGSDYSMDYGPIILKDMNKSLGKWLANLFKQMDVDDKNMVLWGYFFFNFMEWVDNSPFKQLPMEPGDIKEKNSKFLVQWINKIVMIHDQLVHNSYYRIATGHGMISNNTLWLFQKIQGQSHLWNPWFSLNNIFKNYQKIIPTVPLNNLLMTMAWVNQCWMEKICNQWIGLKYPNKSLRKTMEDIALMYGNIFQQQPLKFFSLVVDEYKKQHTWLGFHEDKGLAFLQYAPLMGLINFNNDKVFLNLSDHLWLRFHNCSNEIFNESLLNCTTPWIGIGMDNNDISKEDFVNKFFVYSLLAKHGLKFIPFIIALTLCWKHKLHTKIAFNNILRTINKFYLTSSWTDGFIMIALWAQGHHSYEYFSYLIGLSTVIFSDIFLNCVYGVGKRQAIDALEIPAVQLTFIIFGALLSYIIALDL